jgi:hypothetical protein
MNSDRFRKHPRGGFRILCILATLTFVMAAAANAQTNISTCQTISTLGTYQIVANLTTSGFPCLEITGLPAGQFILNGNGYTVQAAANALYIHDNNPNTQIQYSNVNFVITGLGYPINGDIIESSSQSSSIQSSHNTYTATDTTTNHFVSVQSVGNFYSSNDTNTNMYWDIENSTLGSFISDTVTLNQNVVPIDGGIRFVNTEAYVVGGTITGALTSGGGYNVDDAVVSLCNQPSSSPCLAGTVENITASNFFDLGVEFAGPFSGGIVQNNTINGVQGVGAYARYNSSLNLFTIANNQVNGTTNSYPEYATSLALFQGDSSNPDLAFTNNRIVGNAIGSNSVSTRSYLGTGVTSSGNVAANNNFGAGATVNFASSPGTADGGGNACNNTSPAGVLNCGAALPGPYLRTDTATQGNWINVYGQDGYAIPGVGESLPSYAGASAFFAFYNTWTTSTSDPRAVEVPPSGTSRIASDYYSTSSFDMYIWLYDGNSHQVALYFDDWDNQGRVETVQLINTSTNAVLDTRTISNFYGTPLYLVYNISGNVAFKITNSGGPSAVLNAVFFDNPPAYLRTDIATQGNWIGVYGQDGYMIPNLGVSLPSYALAAPSLDATYTWTTSTSDPRAVEVPPSGGSRIASCYYSTNIFDMNIWIQDGNSHQVALYFDDWDNFTGGRLETVLLINPANGQILDARGVSGFNGAPQYLVYNINGNVEFQIINNNPNANAVLNGVFFGQ